MNNARWKTKNRGKLNIVRMNAVEHKGQDARLGVRGADQPKARNLGKHLLMELGLNFECSHKISWSNPN